MNLRVAAGTALLSVAAVAAVAAVGSAVVVANDDHEASRVDVEATGAAPAGNPAAAYVHPGPRVEYPPDLVASTRVAADTRWDTDPVVFQETDDGPRLFAAKADLEMQFLALRARARGLPYNTADLLVPLHNGRAELVGYLVVGVGILRPEQVAPPGFDLCAVEVAAEERKRATLTEMKARGEPSFVRDTPIPTDSPAERFRCTPR